MKNKHEDWIENMNGGVNVKIENIQVKIVHGKWLCDLWRETKLKGHNVLLIEF